MPGGETGVEAAGVPVPVEPLATSVSTRLLEIVVVQVMKLPPPFSEPLHWSTDTGNAALVVPEAVQVIIPPPPLPDPLHWVTVAEPSELGIHAVMSVPPPPPEPMHWFRVSAVAAAGALALMLLTMSTEQIVVLPPTLSEPLHWWTALMTSDGLAVSPVQAFSVHDLRMTTDEVPPLASMVLTIETEHVTVNGAPAGPASLLLHWENETVAADAGSGRATRSTAPSAAIESVTAATNANVRRAQRATRGSEWNERASSNYFRYGISLRWCAQLRHRSVTYA